jgi:ABC-type proline/glycine betaine transport system permease subunit
MGMNLLIYIEKILDKLQSILHTLAGWVVAILLFLADFIVGHELAVGLVVFVTLIYIAFSEDKRHLYRRQIAQVSFADVTALFADFGRIG